MKKLSLIVLFSFFPFYCQSTCIVVHKTENEIYVGSDSKEGTTNLYLNGGTLEVINNNCCKIKKCGTFYLAIAGHGNTQILNTASKDCSKSKTLKELVDNTYENIRETLENTLKEERRINSEWYANQWTKYDTIARVATFCFEKNKPQLVIMNFILISAPNEFPIVVREIKWNGQHVVLGISDHIDNLPKEKAQELADLTKSNPIEGIKETIKIEKDECSRYVGGDIYVLKLTAKGEIWYPQKNACQE